MNIFFSLEVFGERDFFYVELKYFLLLCLFVSIV